MPGQSAARGEVQVGEQCMGSVCLVSHSCDSTETLHCPEEAEWIICIT